MTSLTYQPTHQDLLDACRLHDLSVVLGRVRLTFACVYTAGIIALVYAVLRLVYGWFTAGAFALAIGLTTIGGLLALRYALLPRYLVGRLLKERRTPLGDWHLTLSKHGYTARGDTASSDVAWSHFLRWRENARVILLYQSWQQYTFVPKRVLQPSDAEFLKEQLRAAGVPKVRIVLS